MKYRTKKKNNLNKLVQKGGAKKKTAEQVNKDSLFNECKESMMVLTQEKNRLEVNQRVEDDFEKAYTLFRSKNSVQNESYSVQGKKITSMTIDDNINNYSNNLVTQIKQSYSSKKNRKITFLRAHCTYGDNLFKVPPNLTFCFLTPLNNYSFLANKTNMFEKSYSKANRKKYFKSIFNYHFNYFDKEKIICKPYTDNSEIIKINMDYFREATWYFPSQWCPNSTLSMTKKDFDLKPEEFNFFSVTKASSYSIFKDNDILKKCFEKKDKFRVNISDIVNEQTLFKTDYNYIVIIMGCRVIPTTQILYEEANKYNFIHYHLTRLICKKAEKKKIKYIPIPSTHITTRPRDILFQLKTLAELEKLKKDITLNLYSSNNPIIRKFIEDLKDLCKKKPINHDELNLLCQSINYYTYKLNNDKIFNLALVITELFHKSNIDDSLAEELIKTCFNKKTVDYKTKVLSYTLNSVIKKIAHDTDTIDTGKYLNLNITLMLSIIKRYKYILQLTEHFKIPNSENLPLNFKINKTLQNLYGLYNLNSNIFSKTPDNNSFYTDNENTYFYNYKLKEIKDTVSYIIQYSKKQNQIVLYKCDFKCDKVHVLPSIMCKELLIAYCFHVSVISRFNLNVDKIVIRNTQFPIGILKLENVKNLILYKNNLKNLFLNCEKLKYLNLEISNNSTFIPKQFKLTNLETLIIKCTDLHNNNISNLFCPDSPRVKKIHLENLDLSYADNTQWNLKKYLLLEELSIINCLFNDKAKLKNNFFLPYKYLNKLELMRVNIDHIKQVILNLEKSPKITELTLKSLINYKSESTFTDVIKKLKLQNTIRIGLLDDDIFPSLQCLYH